MPHNSSGLHLKHGTMSSSFDYRVESIEGKKKKKKKKKKERKIKRRKNRQLTNYKKTF